MDKKAGLHSRIDCYFSGSYNSNFDSNYNDDQTSSWASYRKLFLRSLNASYLDFWPLWLKIAILDVAKLKRYRIVWFTLKRFRLLQIEWRYTGQEQLWKQKQLKQKERVKRQKHLERQELFEFLIAILTLETLIYHIYIFGYNCQTEQRGNFQNWSLLSVW